MVGVVSWHPWIIWPLLLGLGIAYAMLGHIIIGYPT
jgi:hypothetical protein